MTKTKIQDENQGRNNPSFYMELTKNALFSNAFINNIRSVEHFTSELILLKLAKGALRISGKNLELSIYENSSVEINGNIICAEFI